MAPILLDRQLVTSQGRSIYKARNVRRSNALN
jgi:hypothetical protein